MKVADAAGRTAAMVELWALCRDLDIASDAATDDTVARHHTMTAPLPETRTDSIGRLYVVRQKGAARSNRTPVRGSLVGQTSDPRAAETAGGPANTDGGC